MLRGICAAVRWVTWRCVRDGGEEGEVREDFAIGERAEGQAFGISLGGYTAAIDTSIYERETK